MTNSPNRPQSPAPAPNGKPVVGITMGDPAGIGAEVIVKALADPEIRRLGRFVIYGVEEILAAVADAAEINPFWFRVDPGDPLRIDSGVVVSDFSNHPAGYWLVARPTQRGGEASIEFLDVAIAGAKSQAIDAIVTGPIHKTSWHMSGCRFAGHTEKLADAFNAKRVTMAFFGGGLNVALASAHVGLFALRNGFTIGLVFQPIDLLAQALRDWFGLERPRIAVAGLNPHAGENGRFGDEEQRVIEPAIQMAKNAGIDVHGPFPPDTMFRPEHRKQFDGFVCMYHDQGLIPVKLLAFDSSVNTTLGLPIIRTSVDHGTAFDIAGTNQANSGSMKEAIRLACKMATLRRMRVVQPTVTASYT